MTITTVEKDGLFYNFHYIGNNVCWWERFIKYQKKYDYASIRGGANGFLHSLRNVDKAHVWVAYVSNVPPKKHYPTDSEISTIEMAMTVTTSELSCFSMHMGIFRSLLYTGEKHPCISMKLHGFASEQIVKDNFEVPKTYMVTVPLDRMRSIMEESLQSQGKKIYTDRDEFIFKIDCGRNQSGYYNNNWFNSLSMYDHKGNEIFNWTEENRAVDQDMLWFLGHSDVFGTPYPFTITRLDDLMTVGGFVNQDESKDSFFTVEDIIMRYCDDHDVTDIHTFTTNVKAISGEDTELLGELLQFINAQDIE